MECWGGPIQGEPGSATVRLSRFLLRRLASLLLGAVGFGFALGLAIGLALLASGCVFQAEPPAACGVWPAVMVWPDEPERNAEERLGRVLDLWDVAGGGEYARAIFDTFGSVTFFRQGEALRVLRAGDLAARHLLVERREDRLWTEAAEVGC